MKVVSCYFTVPLLFWVFLLASCSAQISQINATADGTAIKGYDPVAYFTEGQPVKGRKEYQFEWQGAKWLFASQEHLAMFKEDPEKYAPQYGGY